MVGFLIGGMAALGCLVAVAGVIGVPDGPSRQRRSLPDIDRLLARVLLAIAAGVGAALLTRWIAAFAMGVLVVLLLPSLVGARRRRDEVIAKTEAVASWAEMLRDTLAASAGLQAAITASSKVAPASIEVKVRELATSMQRDGLPTALRRFALEIEDPAADIVVLALTVAATRQASHVGEVLDRAASAARATSAMRVSVEASRARTFTSARIIVGVTIAMAVAIATFSGSYLDPFDAAPGQLVLIVIAALFGAGLWSLNRLARIDTGPRVLLRGDPR
jgi:Flp pilus assembly protein TadB